MMSRFATSLAVPIWVAWSLAAHASEPDESASAVTPSSIEVVPAVPRNDEGLWSWVERMDGEVLPVEALVALEQRADEHFALLALSDTIGKVDVPIDFYRDPRRVIAGDPLHLDRLDPDEFDIPVVVNDSVERSLRYFLGSGRRFFGTWLERTGRYETMMHRELENAGLPKDIIYLSMIESGYSTYAYSHAHAAGLWQFIPSTGKMYDLRIDWWVDERRDPVKATRSALRYLRDLHAMFDDWLLAFAAYNGGPGRIRRALDEAGEGADFWTLQEGPYLHPETDNYVPRILAAAIIAKHPERYGFRGLVKDRPLRHDTVTVDGSVEMEILAECAGLSVDDFRALNPALRRGATPQGRFEVHVPVGKGQSFLTALDGVPSSRRRTYTSHRVSSGETLGTIASRYGTDLEELVQANGLDDANRIYVGMTVLVPTSGGERAEVPALSTSSDAKSMAPDRSEAATSAATEVSTSYTVKSGDTLGEIAESHGVSVSQIRSWNGMRGTRIYPGQKLELRGVDAARTKIYYTVGKGDSLSQIATRYGVPMSSIQSWNNVSDSSHIYVGQELVLHLDEARWRVYLVKAGDNLGAIARSNDCSVDDLLTWNDLGSSKIFPGQKLRIKR